MEAPSHRDWRAHAPSDTLDVPVCAKRAALMAMLAHVVKQVSLGQKACIYMCINHKMAASPPKNRRDCMQPIAPQPAQGKRRGLRRTGGSQASEPHPSASLGMGHIQLLLFLHWGHGMQAPARAQHPKPQASIPDPLS